MGFSFEISCVEVQPSRPALFIGSRVHVKIPAPSAGFDIKRVPSLGLLIKPVMTNVSLEFTGYELPSAGSKIVLESVTDADWVGSKATRRSKSSVHLYLGGSLIASFVRSQRSVALSSGESEFVAMVSGATEVVYLRECIGFMTKDLYQVDSILQSDSAAGRGISQRIGCGRVRRLDCGLLWIQDGVKRKWFRVGPISGAKNAADIGTKPLGGPKLRELLCRAGDMDKNGDQYGTEELGKAEVRQVLKSGAWNGPKLKQVLPVLMILLQVLGAEDTEGLGLAMVVASVEESFLPLTATAVVGIPFALMMMILDVPWCLWKGVQACANMFKNEPARTIKVKDVGIQADRGVSAVEERFTQEYVAKCNENKSLRREEMANSAKCAEELNMCREEIRKLDRELTVVRQRVGVPNEVSIATNHGTVFRKPQCPALTSGSKTKTYRPCHQCFGA